MSIETSVIYKLPETLRTLFWVQFFEVMAEELELYQSEKLISQKTYNDIDLNLEDRIIEICQRYGYTPDLTLDFSVANLQKEARSLVYRIKHKTGRKGYQVIFDFALRLGYVYNILWEGEKLVRVEDKVALSTALSTISYTTPFLNYLPEFNFGALIDVTVGLDVGLSLDEVPVWYLDTNITNIVTSHLAIEYICDRIITEESIEYLMTPLLLDYLNAGTLYNKKASDVPHVGCQITSVLDGSGIIDNNNPVGIGVTPYTIPIIKLQSAVTSNYIAKLATSSDPLLDDGLILDDGTWTLDGVASGSGTIDIDNDFYYLVAGTGSRGQISHALATIYDVDQAKLHLGLGEELSATIQDSSPNAYDGTLTGNITRREGIVSRTINFDGATYANINGVSISTAVDQTLGFWFNISECVANEQLFDTDYIAVEYNIATEELSITLTGSTASVTSTISIPYTDVNYFCQLEYDPTLLQLRVFIDTVLEDTLDISGAGAIGGAKNFVLGFDGVTYFTGVLDDLSVYTKFFSNDEKEYIFDNRLGSGLFLNNKVYEIALSVHEKSIINSFYNVQGYVRANTVNIEIAGVGDGVETTFSGVTQFTGLLSKSFKISYPSGVNIQTAQDNGVGVVLGEYISGTINTTTGEYTINCYRDYPSINEISGTGVLSNLNYTTTYTNIVPSTLVVSYQISGNTFTGVDDGAGNITGTGLTSSTVNYLTGDVSLTFTSPTDDADILTTYDYRLTAIPDNLSFLNIEYKTTEPLEITEVGIEDLNHKLVAYATFPPVRMNIGDYHLAYQFLIRQ